MTRMLAEMLGAEQPRFRWQIQELERANGGPSTDIRLTTTILQRTKLKIQELGLDPQDTTGPELYAALAQQLLGDEVRLRDSVGVRQDASSTDVLLRMQSLEKKLAIPRQCFAIKLSVAKRLLKTVPPKRAMAQLGYRSLDSMLKHEPIPQLYVAALLYETSSWRKALLDQYSTIRPSDFESRAIHIYYPQSKRWESVATEFANQRRHICQVLQELGSVVVLPVVADVPALAITTLLLLLDSVNSIRCSSTYLKLQQVRSDFGKHIAKVAQDEPYTQMRFAGRLLPWRVLQHYYQSMHAQYFPELFEPHVQPEDMALAHAEVALAKVLPALEFWQGTTNLALVDNNQTVSLNMLDVALNVANSLPYDERVVENLRKSIWTKLMVSYLHPGNLEHILREVVGNQTLEPALEMVRT